MTERLRVLPGFLIAACLLAFSLTVAACGGGGASCEDVGERLCADACACTADGTCAFADSSGGVLTFDSEGDCVALLVGLGCAEDTGDFDFESCDSALDSASCVDPGDGTMALETPAACE